MLPTDYPFIQSMNKTETRNSYYTSSLTNHGSTFNAEDGLVKNFGSACTMRAVENANNGSTVKRRDVNSDSKGNFKNVYTVAMHNSGGSTDTDEDTYNDEYSYESNSSWHTGGHSASTGGSLSTNASVSTGGSFRSLTLTDPSQQAVSSRALPQSSLSIAASNGGDFSVSTSSTGSFTTVLSTYDARAQGDTSQDTTPSYYSKRSNGRKNIETYIPPQRQSNSQVHQSSSSKRVQKWKKNKKKYEEQMQSNHHVNMNHETDRSNSNNIVQDRDSPWTRNYEKGIDHQWPIHGSDSMNKSPADSILIEQSVTNKSNNPLASMPPHLEEYRKIITDSRRSSSLSSATSLPLQTYSFSQTCSASLNTIELKNRLQENELQSNETTNEENLSAFFSKGSSARSINSRPETAPVLLKTGVPTTSVLATADSIAANTSASLPATHTARADGDLSKLRKQIQQKQEEEMVLYCQGSNEQKSCMTTTTTSSLAQSSLDGYSVTNSLFSSNASLDMNMTVGEDSVFTLSTTTTGTGSLDGFADFRSHNADLEGNSLLGGDGSGINLLHTPKAKKREWLLRMNRRLNETPIGEVNPEVLPITAIMNAWAKTKSSEGANMVEMWLRRLRDEREAGNEAAEITTKMYTMAVDAWAKSGEKGSAMHAETILHQLNTYYQQSNREESLRPTTGIFNAVINAWARSGDKIAPQRAEQILEWMEKLYSRGYSSVKPDKYTFNTVIHAYAKVGGKEAAIKAQHLLQHMHMMHVEGNSSAKPDTITYNVVINCLAKSGGKGAALEAEKLLSKMHMLHDAGDADVKPNVVTYGAVIDAWAKSGEKGAAGRADNILANMIQKHQSDPVRNADLRPNTYTFNTVINAWAKSKEPDAASKAEEMLVAMGRLHTCGIPGLKPDAFTYTAVIDAWAKSGYRGAATRADQLLDKMEAQYQAGDYDLKPNTFTYNAVINALAKSGEPGAAARAERVLHNMVNRHHIGEMSDDVKPTTINFNTVLDAWAKSGGKGAAERAEEILDWMDKLHKAGNKDVKPDTITFNAVIDAWARSGDKRAPKRAEQILDHMDDMFQAGNHGVKPDTYTYNTVINAWAKSGEKGSASRAEQILAVMERRYRDGDSNFKPNTRTHTSVIDAWAKSGERGAAARAEQILNTMQALYESTKDPDTKPNAHTCNAVMNACAFTKTEEDRGAALEIAFRVFDWLSSCPDMHPDAYTFTILLSVCSNLLPREDEKSRFVYADTLFRKCCEAGHVNSFVLRKLKQTVTEEQYITMVGDNGSRDPYGENLPPEWTRNAKINSSRNRRKNKSWNSKSSDRRCR